jgi:heptosyltransferase-2
LKILIIQQKMIGDVLTTSILFEALKAEHPDAELHYVINSHTYPVIENNPFIDKLLFVTPEMEDNKSKFFTFLNVIKNENYDAVIDVYSKLSSNLMTKFSGAKIKISKKKWYTSHCYTHTFKDAKTPKANAGLAIENRLQLLQPLCDNIPAILKPKIYLTPKEIEDSKQFLIDSKIDLSQPLFMISVLGSSENKTYPFEYMAKVIDKIVLEQPKSQVLFNYIPKQKEDAKAILELCSLESKKHILFEVFGKSLREFLAITSHCDTVIGNEGGAINMAKALNKPTFTIFSPWIKKEDWNLFDDGFKHVSVHLKDYNKTLYPNSKHPKELKHKASELYQKFKPSYFGRQLDVFLMQFS